MLVKLIGMGCDLHPFATAGDNREDRASSRNGKHIMLELGHVFFRSRLFRERPRQHEFGFKHRPGCLYAAVECGCHPPQRRMAHLLLHGSKHLPGIGLIPAPIQLLSGQAELDDEVAGEVLWLDLAALLPPEPEEGSFIAAYDDPSVRTANKRAPRSASINR